MKKLKLTDERVSMHSGSYVTEARPERSERSIDPLDLNDAPLPSGCVISGHPRARNRMLSGSTDGLAATFLWDCTAGRFRWFYDVDETIYLLTGAVTIADASGTRHHLKAGDTFFFPAGTHFEWFVDSYVRKIAFLHSPLSRRILLLRRLHRALGRLMPIRLRRAQRV